MKNNNKIAIVSASLGVGGAERFAGLLSFMLHDLGYEVHHIIILDHVDYDFQGELVNLGKMFSNEFSVFRAIKKGKYIAKYLFEKNIEIVIDNRSRPTCIREVFTKWIYGNRKTYFMVHSSNLEIYFPKSSFAANYLYKNTTKLVCVSKDIESKIRKKWNFENTATIYNPIVLQKEIALKPANTPQNYILFFGRLEEEIKNFSLMLNAFQQSKVYETGTTKLLIVGDGSGKDFINAKIGQLKLTDFVELLPFQKNILPYIQHARCTVLTSRYEGFPMNLVESLASGTPVIAVDCETGPKEIVQNEFNGLLVPNYDEKSLSQAIVTMISDENLYQTCKNNAQKSVEHLSLTTIADHWQNLLSQK